MRGRTGWGTLGEKEGEDEEVSSLEALTPAV